ncbi:hypothetical protein D9V86_05890 [Bacteroidetes/Chlorobi group bacterium ChocPot_Mid]|nr:MAG: hypothetical protein D9V86_05890 [Bacteroidetes/Chlorobi group bacterium ChocPot_Mid]
MRKIYLFSIVFVAFIVYSCNENSTSNVTPKDVSKVDVVWSSNTVQFQPEEVTETDSLYSYLIFSKGNVNVHKLKVGSIIFLYGKALKKVTEIDSSGAEINIKTGDCTLNEAITDGEINWAQTIDWNKASATIVLGNTKKESILVEGQNFDVSFPLGSMKGKITLKTKGSRLDALCEISEEINKGTNIKYGFEGFIQNMKSEGSIKLEKGELKEFDCKNKNIEGEVTLQLVAVGSLNQLLGSIELPYTLIKVPIVLAGIPMFLNIKILFVINTKTASIDASAYIKTKFKFNSQTGINYDGTNYGVEASAGPYKYDFIKDSNWVASSVAAGLNFGLTFPRFELEMFGNILVPYAQTAFLIGGSFTTGTKTCLTIDCSFIGAMGVNLKFLGLKSSFSKTLWQYDKNIKKAGTCN